MELGRMMLDGDDEDESTFMNSLDDSCSKSTSITKYLDKSVDGISDDKTEEAEIYIDNKDISKKLPSSLNSASILEQMAACTIPATKTPSYNISSLTFLPYHHMAGGFFSSSSFESTTSQQEDEDTAAACADAAEAVSFLIIKFEFWELIRRWGWSLWVVDVLQNFPVIFLYGFPSIYCPSLPQNIFSTH
ncbi:hypothetical protein ACQ4LE_010377 [Meloidogyne hapla]